MLDSLEYREEVVFATVFDLFYTGVSDVLSAGVRQMCLRGEHVDGGVVPHVF